MSKKKPIEIDVNDHYEVFPDGVFESKVVNSGNGASIPFYKRFLGDEVVVIVKDKIIEQKIATAYQEMGY